MSEHVVKLSEYRRKKSEEQDKNVCWVSFIGHPYMDGGKAKTPRLTIEVQDGDYEAVISSVREDGGFYIRRPLDALFSPWPCAAVEVRYSYARDALDIPQTSPFR